jgi:hypothetical protein
MKFSRSFLILSHIPLLIPLALFSYHGFFSRYLADDFCTSAYLKQQGFLQSMQFWRLTWSGRYSFYFFMNTLQSLGQWITPFMTGITILTWLAALFLFTRLLLRALNLHESMLLSLFTASLVLFVTLEGAPDIYQSLYWQTGAVTYVFPLVIFTFYGAFLLKKLSENRKIGVTDAAISAGIPLAAGGFSETYVTVQTAAILAFVVLVLLAARGDSRRSGAILLSWGLAGSTAALFLVVGAPGNAARISLIPENIRGFELLFATFQHTWTFTKSALYFNPLPAITALLAPGLLVSILKTQHNDVPAILSFPRKNLLFFLLTIPLLTFLLIASAIAPSLYATADPTQRALITAQFILIASFVVWSLLLGISFRGNVRKYTMLTAPVVLATLILLVFGSVLSLQKTAVTLPDVQNNAALWDRRDREVRAAAAAGADKVEAISLPHLSAGLAELSYHPEDWVNQCFALYYNLKEVSGR